MEFTDEEIEALDIKNQVNDFINLVIKYLCGKDEEISSKDVELLKEMLSNVNVIKYNQFNEILLLMNRDIVSEGFFNLFFNEDGIKIDDLKKKISYFRGYSMLCYGNFRFAYKELSSKSYAEIKETLEPFCVYDNVIEEYKNRTPIMLKINNIPREKTWLTGYLSTKKITEDIKTITEQMKDARNAEDEERVKTLLKINEKIDELKEELIKFQRIALKNTDAYLTWDFIDVYVATSMRNKWEFEEIYDFIKQVFSNEVLETLNLRYFDPTQSLCISQRDKGIIEGLMLKRSSCTIYLAQESDTMGKDSELATTLAQGKPVIVYVPSIQVEEYSEKIKNFSLDFIKKRFLHLESQEVFDDPEVVDLLNRAYPKHKEIRRNFMHELEMYEEEQIFFTVVEDDEATFKKEFEDFSSLCNILAEVERIHFNKRANLLKKIHPLSMQIALESGVANGVLVVRNAQDCAILLHQILTKNMRFTIKKREYKNDILDEKITGTLLIEDITDCPFRFVSDYEKLTNSFWNLFNK